MNKAAGILILPFTCFLLSAVMMTSCKNDDFTFQDVPTARLVGDENWTLGTDSATVSFASVVSDTLDINVDAYITGEVSNTDRVVNIEVVASATTASATQYKVPATVTIPAGKSKGTFVVELYNDKSLQSKSVRMTIRQAASSDFQVGVIDQNSVSFTWSDMISKPLYWDNISEYFGEYSNEKYRFMLDVLAEKHMSTDLNPESGLTWSDYHNYAIIFTNALKTWNEEHGSPKTDENGAVISFN